MSLRKDYSLSTNSPLTPIRNTSTPFPMRRKSILPSRSSSILSRRYSLSDVDFLSPIQRNSTFFNQNNVSNLLKSPNNSRRSSENKEKLLINHQQMKYSTPGVFPIVHLNKPNLPILKEKSKNVNGELASPELCRQNSAEHNRLLLEKVVQNCSKLKTTGITTITTTTTSTTTTNRSIDISTRSVLDALKEISRKRIHTSEELDYLDDGKRIRLDNNNDDLLLNLKRPRGESPPHESYQNSSKQQQVKKQCSMNEIVASQSSMEVKLSPPLPPPSVAQASNENKQISRSREIEVEVDVHRPSKKPNLVNAETQTQITENVKDVGVQSKESIPVSIEINKDNIEKSTIVETTSTTTTVKSSSCLKVFDEAPLERARKDRLSVLMGIKRQSPDIKMNQEEKPITSILSSNINKHLKSPTSKHVTFNLESEPNSESNQQQQQQIVEKTINSTVNNNNLSITQTTASITTPLISSVISEAPKLPDKDIVQTSNETKIVPKITSSLNQTTTTQSIPTFNFTATTNVENSTNSTKSINPVTSFVTATTSNMFDNSNKMGNVPITTTTTTSSTPPKIGGFKFDLNPKSTTSASKFTLVTSTTTTTKTTESSQKPTFFFGGVTKNTPKTHAVLPTTTISPKFSFTSSITTTAAVTTTTTPASSFTQSAFGGTGGFNFTPQTTQSFVNPVTTSTTVGLPTSFGNQPIKSNVFGTNPIVTTNTFGIQPTVSNIFGGITTQTTTAGTKSTFGVAQPTNIFGGIATTTTTAAVAVTTIVTTTTSTFGIQPIQSTTFGSNPAPTFGTSGFNFGASNSFTNTNSIDKPTFGNLQTPQQSLFTPTTTTTSPIAATTTTTSIFNTNVFNSANTTNNPPGFGLNNPPTTNIFGSLPAVTTAPQNPPPSFGFDVNKQSGFNTTSTTPAFGSTTFGTTNQNQPVFGSNLNNSNNNNQPTQASSPPGGVFTFGTNTVNKSTGVFSFGQSEPPKPTFNFTANPTNNTVIGGGGVNSSFTNLNVSFGANPVAPQFNPPVGGAMFSIGSGGSSTPRARTQLKAKRRT